MNLNENEKDLDARLAAYGGKIPKTANDMMSVCMAKIHESLMVPMKDNLTPQQHAILSIIGMTLKIIAEKATLYETLHEGETDLGTLNPNHRN